MLLGRAHVSARRMTKPAAAGSGTNLTCCDQFRIARTLVGLQLFSPDGEGTVGGQAAGGR